MAYARRMLGVEQALQALRSAPLHRFSDWPNPGAPSVTAGVYSIWDGRELIYVGMSGRSATEESLGHAKMRGRAWGLRTRLHSHWSGRRSGDQFVVYVADRLVLPTLTRAQVKAIAAGEHSMDALCRAYIHERLAYRYACVANGTTAFEVEKRARSGALGPFPALNPLHSTGTRRARPRTALPQY
ncbi:MAG TPA: hypothetical protein VMK42_20655 [Anaeromyxobacteraceae bacterium]|nr:hypothetical protein [Anaeromyxobacteraceae bacterium]